MTRVEAYRAGEKLVRDLAGDDYVKNGYSLFSFRFEFRSSLTTEEIAYLNLIIDAQNNRCELNYYEDSLIELIENYPNDADLGEVVRRLYNR